VAVSIGTVIVRRLRRNIDNLTHYYETLLRTADEQSRQAESANRLTCVIVLELSLPVMDGLHFRTVQLRDRSLAWIPVVVMSGAVDGDRRARDLGARWFVRKPLNLGELRHALRRIGCCQARPHAEVALDPALASREG
jgi:CheY-like chemotaxis protein